MPTARQRHLVTATPAVAEALDRAAKRWPGEPRSKLLLRLVAVGSATLDDETERTERTRVAAVLSTSGKYADAFEDDHLETLRRDWPT